MGIEAELEAPKAIRLADYRVPDHLIDALDLSVDLHEDGAVVTARLRGRRNPDAQGSRAPLHLDGQDQELIDIVLDGRTLGPGDYMLGIESLEILDIGESFDLVIRSRNKPAENTALEGLYLSNGMYCTQCEAEGFRRITYFPDRPDVMTVFTSTISAAKAAYPVLLSNGNLVETGNLDGGRHFARWHDPFPKPAYLFAMVAGDLAMVEDSFTTMSGRKVTLRIFVEHGDENRCGHAMDSLKRSMAWDEERFGLEYDLDLFMIVAVSHFNMGAMENKGLNVFNSRYVLADPETATDVDFQRIEAIVAHEYFHNWTGNRVTCRDWFQLSLKEGLTVFRDQEFTADTHSRGVKRVSDARLVRSVQFTEDAGPTAHPVRPDSYIEINNFYTVTVYEKGAEVVRLIHTRIGEDGFRAGMDLYFQRHDGQAVTCEDFVAAMQDASGVDLSDMKLWYEQAGTPELSVQVLHDAANRRATLKVSQHVPDTPKQSNKKPMPIPLGVGLLDRTGAELPLRLEGETANEAPTDRILTVTEAEQAFVFENIAEPPVPSLLRNFSAPVKLTADLPPEDLAILMAHDRDPFARWDAGQRYASGLMLGLVADRAAGRAFRLPAAFIEAIEATLTDENLEPAFRAEALRLPSQGELAQAMEIADVDGIFAAGEFAYETLGEALYDRFLAIYRRAMAVQGREDLSTAAMGNRALGNTALVYLAASGREEGRRLAKQQVESGASMTLVMGGLNALNGIGCPEREAAMAIFHDRWQHRPMELDKWFSLTAMSSLPDALEKVRALLLHPGYDMRNPNRVRAVVGAFASGNQVRFHAADGAGYRFLADRVLELETVNPQVAARLLQPLTRWRRYDEGRRELMVQQLTRVVETPGLSKDVYEIASKGLAG
jgi:aminopeptidase N